MGNVFRVSFLFSFFFLFILRLSAFDSWTIDESLFNSAVLIDEVKCGNKKSKQPNAQFPADDKEAVVIQKILNVPCRILIPSGSGMRYMV